MSNKRIMALTVADAFNHTIVVAHNANAIRTAPMLNRMLLSISFEY